MRAPTSATTTDRRPVREARQRSGVGLGRPRLRLAVVAAVTAIGFSASVVHGGPLAAQEEPGQSPSTSAPALLVEGTTTVAPAPDTPDQADTPSAGPGTAGETPTSATSVPESRSPGDDGVGASTRLWGAVVALAVIGAVVLGLTLAFWRSTRPRTSKTAASSESRQRTVDLDAFLRLDERERGSDGESDGPSQH